MKLFKQIIILLGIIFFIVLNNIFAMTTEDCSKGFARDNKNLQSYLNEGLINKAQYSEGLGAIVRSLALCNKQADYDSAAPAPVETECREGTFENYLGQCVSGQPGSGLTKVDKKGNIVTENQDGTVTTVNKDGTRITRDKDGKKIVHLQNGNIKVVDKEGNTSTFKSDGTPVSIGGEPVKDNPTKVTNTDVGEMFNATAPTLTEYCKKKLDKNGLIKYDGVCDGEGGILKKDEKGVGNGYNEFIGTVNRVIGWVVNIALLIAAAMAFYGGFLYISSATDPAARSKANKLFTNVAIGLFLIFAAWFIVKFVLDVFATGKSAGQYSGLKK